MRKHSGHEVHVRVTATCSCGDGCGFDIRENNNYMRDLQRLGRFISENLQCRNRVVESQTNIDPGTLTAFDPRQFLNPEFSTITSTGPNEYGIQYLGSSTTQEVPYITRINARVGQTARIDPTYDPSSQA